LDVLANKSISTIATVHKVSRNTAYSQKATAVNAVNEAFSKKADGVIFHLPVTKAIIAQMMG